MSRRRGGVLPEQANTQHEYGEPAVGPRAYIGWAVLMASMIRFSTLLGMLLGEWNGTSRRTRTRLAAGLALLIILSLIAGISGHLKAV